MSLKRVNGVYFDGKHSYYDFGLWLSNRPDLGSPNPKTNTIEVPGADGIIDMTEANAGEVKFTNRTITLTFAAMVDIDKQAEFRADLANALHGKKINQIVFDDDPEWYYTGRATVRFTDVQPWRLKVIISIDAAPYAMRLDETVVDLTQGVSSVNEVQFGQETSIINFNSDIRMGTSDFPDGIPAGGLSDLIISWPENPTTVGSYIEWQVVDADGHVFNSNFTYPRPSGEDPTSIRTPLADIEEDGIDLSRVYRILVSGIGGCVASIEKLSIETSVYNERKNVIPKFVLDAEDAIEIIVNGKSVEVPVGTTILDEIVLTHGINQIFVSELGSDVNVFTMSFREGKL